MAATASAVAMYAEDDHSFSTPFAIRPTSANSASVAAR